MPNILWCLLCPSEDRWGRPINPFMSKTGVHGLEQHCIQAHGQEPVSPRPKEAKPEPMFDLAEYEKPRETQ